MNKEIKKVQKIQYAEFVKLSEDEFQRLVTKYGDEKTARMIEVLDNYKGSSGKKYKSDYRAILNWVASKVEQEFKQKPKEVSFDVELAERQAREAPIDFGARKNSRHKKTATAY